MGAAYYIVLNSENPGFDITFDGKALARNQNAIDRIASLLGFSALAEFVSQSKDQARDQIAEMMDIEISSNLPPELEAAFDNIPPEAWYDAALGLKYGKEIGDHIREHPDAVKDPVAVLFDLDTMVTVMTQALKGNLEWHFKVDF